MLVLCLSNLEYNGFTRVSVEIDHIVINLIDVTVKIEHFGVTCGMGRYHNGGSSHNGRRDASAGNRAPRRSRGFPDSSL